jgi:hypothetical protein
MATAYAWYRRFNKGKGITPGIGDLIKGKVMATDYAWYWRFNKG